VSDRPETPAPDLIYGLHDRPPFLEAGLVGLQHVLAVFVGIVTPPLIVSQALDLELRDASYIVGMSLFVSGVATFVQTRRIGPVGSGLLSVQGTSFSFLAPVIAVATGALGAGADPRAALAVVFGVCFAGAFVEIGLSGALAHARRVVTPLVSGIVVTLIGLTLVRVGAETLCGGPAARDDGSFASLQNLGLGGLVMLVIVALNRTRSRFLRMSSIALGLAAGCAVSLVLGLVDLGRLSEISLFSIPVPFRYGLGFSWSALLPVAFIYVITMIETVGDLTATSSVSGEPIEGDVYLRRIQGGVLGDGVNSLLAAVFNTFPNTTFSQNNGVIQLTGVASRHVGIYISAFLVLLGLFPIVGGLLQVMPPAVLGGATLIMFGTVAATGIRIIATQPLDRRAVTILAVSLATGLGVTFVPEVPDRLPPVLASLFSSGIAAGGLIALGMNLLLPRAKPDR
jgi:xanthine permease XanP